MNTLNVPFIKIDNYTIVIFIKDNFYISMPGYLCKECDLFEDKKGCYYRKIMSWDNLCSSIPYTLSTSSLIFKKSCLFLISKAKVKNLNYENKIIEFSKCQ